MAQNTCNEKTTAWRDIDQAKRPVALCATGLRKQVLGSAFQAGQTALRLCAKHAKPTGISVTDNCGRIHVAQRCIGVDLTQVRAAQRGAAGSDSP